MLYKTFSNNCRSVIQESQDHSKWVVSHLKWVLVKSDNTAYEHCSDVIKLVDEQ